MELKVLVEGLRMEGTDWGMVADLLRNETVPFILPAEQERKISLEMDARF